MNDTVEIVRASLILLQLMGATSVVAWPAVLAASATSLAAQRRLGGPAVTPFTVVLIAARLYPLAWVALFWAGWRAYSSGSFALAFLLSAIPLLCTLGAFGWVRWDSLAITRRERQRQARIRDEIQLQNPLVWRIVSVWSSEFNAIRDSQPVPLLAAVRTAEPGSLSRPVQAWGTPLKAALGGIDIDLKGDPGGKPGGNRDELVSAVQELVRRGAKLSEDESTDLYLAWQLNWILLRSEYTPSSTAQENAMVWDIVSTPEQNRDTMALEHDRSLLSRPTRLYGTPLRTALLCRAASLAQRLIEKGALLSYEERQDPATGKALEWLFGLKPELRDLYDRSMQNGSGAGRP